MRLAESTAIHRLGHLKATPCCQERPHSFAVAYGENNFMLLQMKGLVWGTRQALLRSPRGQNASRDGLVKLGWVHCLQYTLHRFQYNVCGLCRCEPSNQKRSSSSWQTTFATKNVIGDMKGLEIYLHKPK